MGCDIFLLWQQTSSELSGSRLPSELRFSCRQPHILLIKILIEDYEHYFVKQFHRPAAVNLQRPHGSSVVHRARAGNHHRLWWFCWFISNTALSPFTDIPLLKPKEPALQRNSLPRTQMKLTEHFTALMGKKKNCPTAATANIGTSRHSTSLDVGELSNVKRYKTCETRTCSKWHL